jgi:hypothetical protein
MNIERQRPELLLEMHQLSLPSISLTYDFYKLLGEKLRVEIIDASQEVALVVDVRHSFSFSIKSLEYCPKEKVNGLSFTIHHSRAVRQR